MEASSWGTLSLCGFLDSEKGDLIERIGNALKNGEISDEHFDYFKYYRNLTRFMDKYLERLHKAIESEPCGEIIVAPDIDSEMESIMQELKKDQESIGEL